MAKQRNQNKGRSKASSRAQTKPPQSYATAAYNFVPLPTKVLKANKADKLPDHNDFAVDGYSLSGHIDLSITTLAPVYIRAGLSSKSRLGEHSDYDKAQQETSTTQQDFRTLKKNKADFFYSHLKADNEPVYTLPGSSLRGSVRAVFEIITQSKLKFINKGDDTKLFYRAVAGGAYKDTYKQLVRPNAVKAGYLRSVGDEWFVYPADTPQAVITRHNAQTHNTLQTAYAPSFFRLDQEIAKKLEGVKALKEDDYELCWKTVYYTLGTDTESKVIASDAKEAPEGNYVKGVLVGTGNMKTSGSSTKRKWFAVVPDIHPDAKANRIRISKSAINDYCDTLSPFQKEQLGEKGIFTKAPPVIFYVDDEEITFFGHNPYFRVPAAPRGEKRAARPADFLPAKLHETSFVDYTEAVFGYVNGSSESEQGSKERAYASRVHFTDATMLTSFEDCLLSPREQKAIVPKILASPKVSAFAHYLEPSGGEVNHYAKKPQGVKLRGTKRYWHHGLGKHLTAEQIIRHIREEAKLEEKDGKIIDSQHTQFLPLKPGVEFEAKIYFYNLSEVELGALLYSLKPLGEADKLYAHQLGMGKALGLGGVHIKPSLTLTDRQKRYRSLFAGEQFATGNQTLSQEELTKKAQHFETEILKKIAPGKHKLTELHRIQVLLKLMEWEEPTDDKAWRNSHLNVRAQSLALKQFSQQAGLPDALKADEWSRGHLAPINEVQQSLYELREAQSVAQFGNRGANGHADVYEALTKLHKRLVSCPRLYSAQLATSANKLLKAKPDYNAFKSRQGFKDVLIKIAKLAESKDV